MFFIYSEKLYLSFFFVVTGEKNSPTLAHAGCKRRLKWVPGVIAGAPYHGGLQIRWTGPPGWRMGDRPITCHNKKADRKLKMWPRNSQTEWN